ncbi:MAG: thioredoxin domain-containing protein [Candidatus Paceibacterota bacterium]|jgi:protein-disulfide isomerase
MDNENKNNMMLPVSIIVAAILISGSIFLVVGNKNSNNPDGLAQVGAQVPADVSKVTDQDVVLGDTKAPVSFIVYADYQCPFCGKLFSETEQPIIDTYVKTGKVKLVYRNYSFLGPESFAAAEAAEAAREQSKFWEFHDAIYQAEIKDGKENNGNLNRDLFLKIAANLKLDIKVFTAAIDSKKYADLIKKQSEAANAAGINSTPAVFINDQKIEGALPLDQFKTVIDGILAKQK